jgi:ubiquinone/menaquinone biosynthesis C-methylase UbiE
MATLADQTYLKEKQYKCPGNLEARINLHRRFGVNTYPWQRWVFDQLELSSGMRTLELGCGTGELWWRNQDRIPSDVFSILGDLSIGMVRKAKTNISRDENTNFICLDAQYIPIKPTGFDIVIANHMLYHVPNIPGTLLEIWNILKPGGRLYAATNGNGHMIELHKLIKKFKFDYNPDDFGITRFSLESAPEIVGSVFPQVEIHQYNDHLEVTEVDPLVDYIISMRDTLGMNDIDALDNLKNHVLSIIKKVNSFRISKSQGLVIGVKNH